MQFVLLSHYCGHVFINKQQVLFGFWKLLFSLPCYLHKLTSAEAALLASHTSETEIHAADLAGLPFQVAAEIMKGLEVSIEPCKR